MTGCQAVATEPGYPGWVTCEMRHYLGHVEAGLPLRRLAEDSGCHASTVLRQIRKLEARRDDPLVDEALARLAMTHSRDPASRCKDNPIMNIRTSTASLLPDDETLAREARRLLRRLAEPGACLAVAPGMETAVIVRESPDGQAVRTAVLDRSVAQAFALKDWITGGGSGKVARHRITPAGRAALKRFLAEVEAERAGERDAPGRFAAQHQDMDSRDDPQADHAGTGRGKGATRRLRYNAAESPLAILARRRERDGTPFLAPELVAAGERLREDFEIAQMGPRVAQNWDRFLTAGERGGYRADTALRGHEGARARVMAALGDLGPGLGDVALRCCCFLEGLEQAEKRMGWSARSGKVVLRIALQRLRRHYDELGEAAGLIG